MAKKERNFHGEADFLRHYLRELAAETGTVIKDTNFMKKEECKEEIAALNRVKYRKEVETETRANIEKLKRELADRNNQITELQKEKIKLENAKADYTKEIVAKDKKIGELKIEIKDLQESNQFMEGTIQAENKTIAANIEKIEKLEKEIKEKKAEIRASQITLGKREKEIEEYKNRNMQLVEKIDILLAVIKELKNRKWYDPFLFWKKK
jgi:chromosome segregation ATPase